MDPGIITIDECARGLRRGDFSAVELLNACISRIEAGDGIIGAFVVATFEQAREQARAADMRLQRRQARGPLDGIPLALKDNIDLQGIATTSGTNAVRVAERDAVSVSQLRSAGAVFLGKVNMDEAALGAITDNPHHGRTRNPLRTGYTAGGSSGGSAAAVAAGFCIAALGTDTMGSVRIPAAYCGLVGFKPSRRYSDFRGITPLDPQFDHLGPICRSVQDAAYLFSAMSSVPAALEPIDLRELGMARLADFEALALDPEVETVLAGACERIEQAGTGIPCLPAVGIDPPAARRAGLLQIERQASRYFAESIKREPAAYSKTFLELLAFGRRASEERIAAARHITQEAGRALHAALAAVDVLLSATAPQTAFAFESPVPGNQADLTAAANFAGCPAISIPCGRTRSGLPVGLQLMASPGEDTRLLSIARAVEALLAEPAASAPAR